MKNELEKLQEFVNRYGFGISKKELRDKAYRFMACEGYDVLALNEIYLIVNGTSYQFIKSRKNNRWMVKAW